jgi:2-oxoisovalerate dehydrogenase E1 component
LPGELIAGQYNLTHPSIGCDTQVLADAAPGTAAVDRSILQKTLLTRRVEERLLDLFGRGRLSGTVHTCIGQELTGAVISEFAEAGDTVFSNHRGHGHFISFTGKVNELIAEVMGRSTGASRGRGGSGHLHAAGFYSGGIVGGLVPVATGYALSNLLRGSTHVCIAFIGDGTLGEGVLYESLNIACKWRLPLLLVVENNGYAQSTPTSESTAGDIEGRAGALGIEAVRGNTWEWQDLKRVAQSAFARVRSGHGPIVAVVDTYRLGPHSKGDDLRDPETIEAYRARDPVQAFLASGSALVEALDKEACEVVDRAVRIAESSPSPSPPASEAPRPVALEWDAVGPDGRRMVTALQEAFVRLMSDDPHLLFIGEDVAGPYGGAFKASVGLSERFPDRVRNTPISEAAIVGIGAGLALGGWRALVEIMFGDFITLAMDQLVNHVAKLRCLYGLAEGQVVVRTPMGGGRGYGPTHSQTLDRHLVGVPGLRVIALNELVDPGPVYAALLADGGDPAMVVENKDLYGRRLVYALPEGFEAFRSREPLPTVCVRPAGRPTVTLIGYGGMLRHLLAAADDLFMNHDIVAQVVCPTQVFPFCLEPVLLSIEDAPALVVAEEGQGFAGFGAEVLAQIAELSPGAPLRVRRVAAAPIPIPASPVLESLALPSAASVVSAAVALVDAR